MFKDLRAAGSVKTFIYPVIRSGRHVEVFPDLMPPSARQTLRSIAFKNYIIKNIRLSLGNNRSNASTKDNQSNFIRGAPLMQVNVELIRRHDCKSDAIIIIIQVTDEGFDTFLLSDP